MLNIIELDDGKFYTGKPFINLMVKKNHGFRCRFSRLNIPTKPIRESPVDWWGDEHIPPPGTFTEDLQVLSIPGSALAKRAGCARGAGKMVKNRFLGLLQQWMFWGWKHRKCLPSIFWKSLISERWTLNQTFITIYHLPAYYAAAHKTQSK